MDNLEYDSLKTQEYLHSNDINIKMKKLLFKLRCHMIKVGFNYGKKIECPLCYIEVDQQHHLISCFIIKAHNPSVLENVNNCQYSDIFSPDIQKLKNIAILFQTAIRTREILLYKQ